MLLAPLKTEILMLLCWRCRCASTEQIEIATGSTGKQVKAAVRWLVQSRLVGCKQLVAVTYRLQRPLAVGRLQSGSPEMNRIAWALDSRWRVAPRERTSVVWATGLAPRLVGGVAGRLRQPLQLEHDLGVASTYVSYRPNSDERWIGEDAYRRYWQPAPRAKVPDAVLVNDADRVQRVVEFGGRYSRERLVAFDRYWRVLSKTPYEIW